MPPSILGKFPYSCCWMSARPSTRSTILSCWSAFPNLTVSPARPTGGSSHLYRSVDRPFDSGVPRHRLPWFVSVYPGLSPRPSPVHSLYGRCRLTCGIVWTPGPPLRRRHSALRFQLTRRFCRSGRPHP